MTKEQPERICHERRQPKPLVVAEGICGHTLDTIRTREQQAGEWPGSEPGYRGIACLLPEATTVSCSSLRDKIC